ncbi:MAG: hypothetical protein ABIR62_05190 [Dokdonella sp.]|uniref:hypothetical protein n=1 Tax=Dokdonella sp. TaxID=2291710 RepID=UPI0032634797
MKFHLPNNRRAAPPRACCDPAFDDIGDSFWLGAEALVAPACLAALRDADRLVADECADPMWLGI